MLLPFVTAIAFVQVPRTISWTTYEPKEANFSVSFPGTFVLRDDRTKGGRLTGAYLTRGNSGFVVMYCELPSEVDPKTFLPQAWDKHIATQKYAVERRKQFDTWQGRPTYEGEYRLGDKLTGYVRLMVDGRMLIQQLATWTDAERDADTLSTFLASLKFK